MEFKVSVIIPVFNAEPYVRTAVRSALAQPEVGEVLMIEDGSSDDSLAACNELLGEDERLVLLRHQRGDNRGAAATRNLGISQARFPFLTFLDADDTYLTHRFAETAKTFAAYPQCEGVYEAIGMLPTNAPHNKPLLTTLQEPFAGSELFFNISPVGNKGYFSLIGLTVRKLVFAKAGLLNDNLRVAQDTEWMLRLVASCALHPGNITSPVSLRRIHKTNRSTDEAYLRTQKPIMALACLDWFVKHDMSSDKTSEILRVYLKYRFEKYHFNPPKSRLSKKWDNIADGLSLWWKYPMLRRNPLLIYHLKLAFKLPVHQHLNYYEVRG